MKEHCQLPNHRWQSPALIPVILELLRTRSEHKSKSTPHYALDFYWRQYQHWQSIPLSPRQHDWLQAIHAQLQYLTQAN